MKNHLLAAATLAALSACNGWTEPLDINFQNVAPVGAMQSVLVARNTPASITLYAIDANGNALTYAVASAPTHGLLSGTAPALTYTPTAAYVGPDSFTFTANDGLLGSTPTVVSITVVAPGGGPPTADDQALATNEDIALPLVLSGSNPAATFAVADPPANGGLTGTAPNLTYTPTLQFNGTDAFTYTATDAGGTSAAAIVFITVRSINDAPIAAAQSLITAEDVPLTGIVLSATDVDNLSVLLSYQIVTPPAVGALSGTPPNLTFTAPSNFNGPVSFTFRAFDGLVNSLPATVNINVTAVPDVPIATTQVVNTDEETPLLIVLGSDADGDLLFLDTTLDFAHGSLTGTPPNVTYTPDPDYVGPDFMQFTLNDGVLLSGSAFITVNVNPVNDPPQFTTPAAQAGANGLAGSVQITNILAGPMNADDEHSTQSVTFSATASDPAFFTTLVATQTPPTFFPGGTAKLFYMPAPGKTGPVTITLVANDGEIANNLSVGLQQFVMTFSPVQAPVCSLVNVPGGTINGCIPVGYTVTQAQSLPVEVLLEYNAGSGFKVCSQAPGTPGNGEGLLDRPTSPGGVAHTFLWDSTRDIGRADVGGVSLRVRAASPGVLGAPVVLAGVALSNGLSFGNLSALSSGDGPAAVQAADLNRDGLIDLVVANSNEATISVLLGSAVGFLPAVTYSMGNDPRGLAIGDLNRDGQPDLVCCNRLDGSVSVRLQNGPGTFGAEATFAFGASAIGPVLADVDRNGTLDMVVGVSTGPGTATVFLVSGVGNGTFTGGTTVDVLFNLASIAMADLNGDSRPDLVVGSGDAATLSVFLQTTSFNFPVGASFATGGSPMSIAVGDVDRDNKLDLATVDGTAAVISVMIGNGNGTFTGFAGYATGAGPQSVILVDADGDGILDAVSANKGGNSVSVLRGHPTVPGNFLPAMTLVVGAQPLAVAAGDFDRDGRVDLVSADLADDDVTVAYNTQAYRCSADFDASTVAVPGVVIGVPNGSAPTSVALGDLEGDGRLDVIHANYLAQAVSIGLGMGNGRVQGHMNVDLGTEPACVAAGDLNGDGLMDLIAGMALAGNVKVVLQNSAAPGSFLPAQNAGNVSAPRGIAIADLDQDGRPDFVTVAATANAVNVHLQFPASPGQFAFRVPYAVGTSPMGVAIADLNGDGRPDIATANSSSSDISVLFQDPGTPGTFLMPALTLSAGLGTRCIAVGDLNGDGRRDIVVGNGSTNTLTLRFQDVVPGTFLPSVTLTVQNFPGSVAIGDLDQDGRPDLVAANLGSNTYSVLLQDGVTQGSFLAPVHYPTGKRPMSIALGDLDGDYAPDIVLATEVSNDARIYINDHANLGTFGGPRLAANADPRGLAVADLDADGAPDLAVTSNFSSAVSLFLNTGGGFQPKVDVATGLNPRGVVTADFNRDGYMDLAVGSAVGNTVSIHLQNPGAPGTFAAPSTFAQAAVWMAVGDINRDGIPDLAFTTGASVELRQGVGDGTFLAANNQGMDLDRGWVELPDLNGDGLLDLVASRTTAGDVMVRLQNPASPGTFLFPVGYPVGGLSLQFALGDLNGDGRPDAAVATGSTVTVLFQNPASPGAFLPQIQISGTTPAVSIALRDFNGDGRLDIAAAESNFGYLTIIRADPNSPGNFLEPMRLVAGEGCQQVIAADWNRDGIFDLAGANGVEATVSILYGR